MRLEFRVEEMAVALRGHELVIAELLRAQHLDSDGAGFAFVGEPHELGANAQCKRALCLLMRVAQRRERGGAERETLRADPRAVGVEFDRTKIHAGTADE